VTPAVSIESGLKDPIRADTRLRHHGIGRWRTPVTTCRQRNSRQRLAMLL
jgi:hypothetical protein